MSHSVEDGFARRQKLAVGSFTILIHRD